MEQLVDCAAWDLQQQQVQPSRVQTEHALLCVCSFVLAHVHKVMQHSHQGLVGQAVLRKQGPDILSALLVPGSKGRQSAVQAG